jgi:hypothetical protein
MLSAMRIFILIHCVLLLLKAFAVALTPSLALALAELLFAVGPSALNPENSCQSLIRLYAHRTTFWQERSIHLRRIAGAARKFI